MTDSPPPPPPPDSVPPPPPPVAPGSAQRAVGYPTPLPGVRRSAGLVILLSIVTCGIWTFVWSYQNGDELKRWSGQGLGGVFYLLLMLSQLLVPLVGGVITMFLLAGEVEQRFREDGREPPITAIWGLWFLLPIIGNIIWYLRIQRSINEYWTAHGQTNNPSL